MCHFEKFFSLNWTGHQFELTPQMKLNNIKNNQNQILWNIWAVVWPLRVDDHDLKHGSLLHSDITLIVYGGSQITHRGTIAITCSYKRESSRVSFYVTEILGPAIIGLQSSTDLTLFIRTLPFTKTWPHPAAIQLARSNRWKRQIVRDQSVSRMRRVTISLKDDIKKELDKKCHYSEDRKSELVQWFNSFVYRRKQNVEAPPELQRLQCSYSDWISCRSFPRRDPAKSEGC